MLVYRVTSCGDNHQSRHDNAHRLLSVMLSDNTNHSYSELKISENGKPYIDTVPFSISHSGKIAVVAMCVLKSTNKSDVIISDDNCSCIGVDVEAVFDKSRAKCERIAEHKFFDSEKALLNACESDTQYIELFSKLWTKKESYSKKTGEGLSKALCFDTQKAIDGVSFYSDIITLDGKNYAITVCYNSE